MLNSINSLVNFVQSWQKGFPWLPWQRNVDTKLLTIVFLFLSGADHSVKVSSNSESVRAGALLEFFGGYRELMLSNSRSAARKSDITFTNHYHIFSQLPLKFLVDVQKLQTQSAYQKGLDKQGRPRSDCF